MLTTAWGKFLAAALAAIFTAITAGLFPVLWETQEVPVAPLGHYLFSATRYADTMMFYVFAGVLVRAVMGMWREGTSKGRSHMLHFGDTSHQQHHIPTWVLILAHAVCGFGEWLFAVTAAAVALQPDRRIRGTVAVIAILPMVTSIHAVAFRLFRPKIWRETSVRDRWQRIAIVLGALLGVGLLSVENWHHGGFPLSVSVILALVSSMFAAANVWCMHQLRDREVPAATDYFLYALGTELLFLLVGFFTGGVMFMHPWWLVLPTVVAATCGKVLFMSAHRNPDHDPRVTAFVAVAGTGLLTLLVEWVVLDEHPTPWAAVAVGVLAIACISAVVESYQDGEDGDEVLEGAG